MKSLILLFASAIILYSCGEETVDEEIDPNLKEVVDSVTAIRERMAVNYDIEDVLNDKKLTVLMENSSVSYFVYRGKNMGYEYEILREFCKHLGVTLEVKVIHDFNEVATRLNTGEAELVAGFYTITEERKQIIDFTIPFIHTKQVLVQRLPEGYEKMTKEEIESKMIRKREQMEGISIHIFEESSFNKQLIELRDSNNMNFEIVYDTGYFDVEAHIERVAQGEIDYTVSDYHVAMVNQYFYDNLDIEFGTTAETPIAFGVRKSSPGLKRAFDEWFEKEKDKLPVAYFKNKYFKMKKYITKRDDEFSNLGGGKISPYDDLIKKYAAKGVLDWRLIASVIYQESHFNPNTKSWAGAFGLMQFMPNTGKVYGVYPDSPPSVQISGGVRKLNNNYKKWLEEVPDSTEALKFTLASYNAGRGHIDDARKLAQKYGLDPNKWEMNVEYYLLLLRKKYYYRDEVVEYGYCRGTEPAKYVKQIMARYEVYKASFPD